MALELKLHDTLVRTYWWAYKLAYANKHTINHNGQGRNKTFTTQTLASRCSTTIQSLRGQMAGVPLDHMGYCRDAALLNPTTESTRSNMQGVPMFRMAGILDYAGILERDTFDATEAHHIPAPERPAKDWRLPATTLMMFEWEALMPIIHRTLGEPGTLIKRRMPVGEPESDYDPDDDHINYPEHYVTLSNEAFDEYFAVLDNVVCPNAIPVVHDPKYIPIPTEYKETELVPAREFLPWHYLADSAMVHMDHYGMSVQDMRVEMATRGQPMSLDRLRVMIKEPRKIYMNLREASILASVFGMSLPQWTLEIKYDYFAEEA